MTHHASALLDQYDAVVIGGGAAGLSGAITLARSRRSVLVIDSRTPRNAAADGVHAFLGHDGVPPADLYARGREELARYGGQTIVDAVVTAERGDATITVATASGAQVQARRLLVATGAIDTLPQIPGLAQHWGRSLVHCPYCHGWEVRDRAIGVIATSPMAVHQALLFRQLSSDVVVFAHGVELTTQQQTQLQARGIEIVPTSISAVVAGDDGSITGVELADGTLRPREVLTTQTVLAPRLDGLEGLGLPVDENPMGSFVPTSDLGGRTEVPGVWVAGNVTEPMAQVVAAAAAGTMAGAQINADLVMAETEAAVSAAA